MCTKMHEKMIGYLSMTIMTYVCETKMLEHETWETDAEAIGYALFMGGDIQVYSKYGAKTN